MTRRHYIAIAAGIWAELQATRCTSEDRAIESTARRLASIFAEDNPRFDRGKFLAACGVDQGTA